MKPILSTVTVSCRRIALAAIMEGAILSSAMSGAPLTVGAGPWVWQNPQLQGNTLYGVSCPSTEVCYAVGNLGTILKGILNGTNTWSSWSAQRSNTTQTLRAISCPDTLTCFAAGDGGIILGTVDGATWSPASPTTANLTGISCANRAACVAVGSGVAVTYNPVLGWRLQPPLPTVSSGSPY